MISHQSWDKIHFFAWLQITQTILKIQSHSMQPAHMVDLCTSWTTPLIFWTDCCGESDLMSSLCCWLLQCGLRVWCWVLHISLKKLYCSYIIQSREMELRARMLSIPKIAPLLGTELFRQEVRLSVLFFFMCCGCVCRQRGEHVKEFSENHREGFKSQSESANAIMCPLSPVTGTLILRLQSFSLKIYLLFSECVGFWPLTCTHRCLNICGWLRGGTWWAAW